MKIRSTETVNDIRVDRSIPMPPNRKNSIYPWDGMKIGDSFLFPSDAKNSRQGYHNIAKYAGMRRGWSFSVRKTDDGYRCWRVA
jgi:hypothetical protein